MKSKSQKTISLFAILLLSNFIAMAQQNGFVLNGFINELPNGTNLYLVRRINDDTIGRSISKNGRFLFKGKITREAEYFWISLDTNISRVPSNAIWMINSAVNVNGNIQEWPRLKIVGSEPQNEYEKISATLSNFKVDNQSLLHQIDENNRMESKAKDENDSSVLPILTKKKIFLENQLALNKAEQLKEVIEFVESHPNSFFVPYLIIAFESSLQRSKVNELYEKLTNRSKNSFYGLRLKKMLNVKTLEIGSSVENFDGITPEGKLLTLKQVLAQGKYTLLDFWASWCKPCREENSNLRKIYDVYHSKGFNILSISSDTKIINWKRAIEQDSLHWFHISDKDMSMEIAKMYNINALPAYYLLDSNGKVIATDNPLQGTGGALREGMLEQRLKLLLDNPK